MRLDKQFESDGIKKISVFSTRRYLHNLFFIVPLAVVSIVLVNWSDIKSSIQHKIAEVGFKLEVAEINGRNHTTHKELSDALGLKKNEPILSINLSEKREQIEQLGWVEKAFVQRILPNTLRLTIIERNPIALLQTQNGHKLIDRNGEIIAGAKPETFGHLPVVSGEAAALSANGIIEILKTEPELYSEIWAIHHISKRRWNILMKNVITIKLPEMQPGLAWSRLARFDHKNQIIQRDLAVIDMRLPDQILIEPNLPIRGKGQET